MAVNSYAAIVVNGGGLMIRIYELKKSGIKLLDELRHPLPLAQEIYSEGKISFESADEMCLALNDFQRTCLEYGVGASQLYLVHALTDAKNLDFLVTQIRVKTGLKARVLNNSKEHYLALQSIAMRMPDFNNVIASGTLILDIGYGHIQMTLYDQSQLVSTQHNRLGITRIQEMLSGLEMKKSEYPRFVARAIKNDLDEYCGQITGAIKVEHFIIIGGAMAALRSWQNDGAQHYTRAELEKMRTRLYEEKPDEVLAALFEMIAGFLDRLKIAEFEAPDVVLNDGAASDYAYKKFKIFSGHHFTKDRISAAVHLAEKFDCDMAHNLFVLDSARTLFKAVSKPFGLTNKDLQVLELAAIMHHCGRYVSLHDEDELSYEIVKNSAFINLSDENQLLVANVLRYEHGEFPAADKLALDSDYYVVLARITALFRLAAALDDCHSQGFSQLKAEIKNDRYVVRVTSSQKLAIEQRAFERAGGFFSEVFGLRPLLKVKRSIEK